MDRFTIKLGSFLQVPLFLHWSFTLFCIYAAIIDTNFFFMYLAVMATIILHEYGHCIVAKWLDVPCIDITIAPLGGFARILIPDNNPRTEFLVAIGGLPVNIVFGILALSLHQYFVESMSNWIYTFGIIQATITVFNLLPMLPMDGGRVFRSFCVLFLNYKTATTFAVRFGHVVSLSLVFLSFCYGEWLAAFVIFLMMIAGEAELMRVNHSGEIPHKDIRDILMSDATPKDKASRLTDLAKNVSDEEVKASMEQAAMALESRTDAVILGGVTNSN